MKDANITECNFSTDMAPYMYGELSLSERAAFENHLVDCSECTDEFAAISNARYEVYDWKKLEFDPLETPQFEIPFEESVSASWLDKLRAAVGNGWAVPGFAFAGLAIVAVLAAVLFSSSDNSPDVAANISKTDVATPQVNEPTAPLSVVPVERKASVDGPTEPKVIETVVAPATRRSTQRRAVRDEKPAIPTVEPRQASAGRVQPKVPTLNDPAEEEDTSLRLAELFEDVETSD